LNAVTSPDAAIDAVEANLWSMWRQFGNAPGCALHDERGMSWFETPIPVPPYNMVVRCRATDAADLAIGRVFAAFRARGVPFLWFVHPSSEPPDLRRRLGARGFEELELITGMAADLVDLPSRPPVPADVEIRAVTPEHELGAYVEFVAGRWSVPDTARPHLDRIAQTFLIGAPGSPNRAWIAVNDGRAVAKIFTHDCDRIVGVYGMATRVEARGLGLGRLLCIEALAAARDRGCRGAVLHSTSMAMSLYRSVGFQEVAPFSLYGAPESFYA
jgi:GNAT superfamily N-acetyltransferase